MPRHLSEAATVPAWKSIECRIGCAIGTAFCGFECREPLEVGRAGDFGGGDRDDLGGAILHREIDPVALADVEDRPGDRAAERPGAIADVGRHLDLARDDVEAHLVGAVAGRQRGDVRAAG